MIYILNTSFKEIIVVPKKHTNYQYNTWFCCKLVTYCLIRVVRFVACWVFNISFSIILDTSVTETRSWETIPYYFWNTPSGFLGATKRHLASDKPVRHHRYMSTPQQPVQDLNREPADHTPHACHHRVRTPKTDGHWRQVNIPEKQSFGGWS